MARELQNRGVRVAVVKGGFRAWKGAGLPVEDVPLEDMAALPSFRLIGKVCCRRDVDESKAILQSRHGAGPGWIELSVMTRPSRSAARLR